ncbi:probable cytochrome P450 28a5 [Culicoides brevitarsis]|uniref:probable cytochrome P450 28a5 n=1 Tax=Culicoides brevitarsis TaxID=469753 RepID=UPI00307B6C74
MFLLLITLVFVLTAFYFYLKSPYTYWKKLGVPGPEVNSWLGHIPSVWHNKQNYVYEFADIYRKYRFKHPFVGIFVLRQPQLVIIDPKIVKQVLVQKFKCFRDNYFSDPVTKQTDKLLGRNPFNLKGDEWKEKRGELVPGFSVVKIKSQYPIIEDACKKLVAYITAQQNPIDVRDLTARYTSTVVSSCIYGVDAESFSEENPLLLDRARNIMSEKMWTQLKIISFFPFLNKFYKTCYVDSVSEEFFLKLMKDACIHRESSHEKRNDYLEYLIDLQQRKGSTRLDTAANGLTFFLDGFDTSSIFMFFVLYELSKHPEIQLRLREEIEHYFLLHNGKLSYDFVEEMPYLDMVINETLRMHPAIPVVAKLVTEDVELPLADNKTVQIKKGTTVNIPIYCFHNDEAYYTNPEIFDPERFSPETGGTREFKENCVFLPFSDGPRICLGMRFALAQVKRGIVEIVKNFELTLNEKTKEPLKYQRKAFLFISSVENEVLIDFKKI